MSKPKWESGAPAFGTAIALLLSLQARMMRVEAAKRARRTLATLKLLER